MVPRGSLPAVAVSDHSPLPSFGSHTHSTDDACDLGSSVHSNGHEAKQIHEDSVEAGADVIYTTARQSIIVPLYTPPSIHGEIVSFATSKKTENSLSVNQPGCF